MSNPCILCKTSKETNPEAVFHRFPRTKTRCQRWLNALQLDAIKDKTPRELYKSFRLCSNHFSPNNYLTGTHYPGLRESACPDQNLDPDNLPLSTVAAENINSESNSPSNLPNDSWDQRCSQPKQCAPSEVQIIQEVDHRPTSRKGPRPWRYREASTSSSVLQSSTGGHRCSQCKECTPSEIQIIQEVARHPTSCRGPRPWRYQEASASSSTLQSSAATCNSSSLPSSRARHQTTYKTTGEHSHPEEHVGPFRFTDPLPRVENKVALQRTNLASLQRDSESDASETEETTCEMVSQSTQTNTSAPNKMQDLSAPPSQTKTKATKVMNQSATETRAINFEEDETTTQKKETNGTGESETSPAIHTTPGEGTGPTLHSHNLSPKSSLTAKSRLDEANSNNELTSEINNSVQKIVIDDENTIEIGETGSIMYNNSCESEDCEKQMPSEERAMQRTYSGPVRRQVVKTKEGSKRTYMILKRSSLKTLQKKGVIQQVKNNTGNGRHSSSWSSATYSKTFIPPTQLQQNQEKKTDESSSEVEDSACTFSFQELVNSNSTDAIEQFSLVDSSVDLSPLYIPPLDVTPLGDPPLEDPLLDKPALDEPPLDKPPLNEPPLVELPLVKPLLNKPPLDVQIPPNPVTSQSSETPYNSHTASVALGTPSSQGNQIPVVVTWSGTSVTDAQSFSFTIKLSDQMDKCAIVQNTAAKGSMSKEIVLKAPRPLTDPAEGSCNMNQQISSTTADQPDPLSYIGEGSCVDPGTSCSTTSKQKSRWNLSQTSVVCFPSEDEELSCDSPPPMDSSDPLDISEGPSQSRMETVEHLDRILENDYPANKGKMCRYNKEGSESTFDATKGVQWVALPTESVNKAYNHSQSPKRTPVCESSTQELEDFYETAKQRLKDRYKQLLNKHRQRYCQLLRKYKSLERKCHLSHYIGTREQIVRDAKRYLPEEHILFLESQMFLRNRSGTGNRFSKKFIRFMMSLYERSSAGYRFLRTIFTIPSIKTIHKWQSRPYDILEESQKDPLEIIVDTHEVEMMGGGVSGDTEYRQENLTVSYSMEAIQREFFPSTIHFKDEEEFEEGESSCEISDDSLDSEVLDDDDYRVGDYEEEEEMEEEELAENAGLTYGSYTYQ